MPALNDQHRDFVDNCHSIFTGDPKTILVKVEKEEDEEDAAEAEPAGEDGEEGEEGKLNLSDVTEEEEVKIPPKNLTELDRLSYVVNAIENDCQLVPVGSIKMTPMHEVRRNQAFKGLSPNEATNLGNYMHFRNVQSGSKKLQLDEANTPFLAKFLESVSEDFPYGQWTVQKDMTNKFVHLRCLSWPGFQAFHKVNSKDFGCLYFGDGLKNHELPFMI